MYMKKKYIVKDIPTPAAYVSAILEQYLNDPELIDNYELITTIVIKGYPIKAIYKLK